MAYRNEEIKTYRTTLICDDCKKEVVLHESNQSFPNFDTKMNGTIQKSFTFKNYGDGAFKNYCNDCKKKYD